MNFGNLVAEHQRLLILQMLEQDAGYSHNEAVLKSGLAAMGHAISTAALHSTIDWLSDAALVTSDDVESVGKVVKITSRGLDVALGQTVVTGVARRVPGV